MMRKLALVFPGSGSQYVGMVKRLYENYPQVRQLFAQANQVTGQDITTLCMSGSIIKLSEPTIMALCIYTTSVAHYLAFKQYLSENSNSAVIGYMMGHSLGEYAALTCSGALSFVQALELVALRSQLASDIANQVDAGTSIIKQGNLDLVTAACEFARNETKQQVDIACYNSDQQFMLSGYNTAIIVAEQYLLDNDPQVQVVPLMGGVPYHHPLLRPYGIQLREVLEKCQWQQPNCQVIANVSGQPYTNAGMMIDLLEQQLSYPVQWQRGLDFLKSEQAPIAIEIGPQSVLKNLLIENNYPADVYAFDDRQDREKLKLALISHNATSNDADSHQRWYLNQLINAITATRNHNANNAFINAQLKMILGQFFNYVQVIEQHETISAQDIELLNELFEQVLVLKGSSQQDIANCRGMLIK
ncbi:transacylase [Gilliamella sp. App2-1]|nr:transacylase [Gilliamella apicola]